MRRKAMTTEDRTTTKAIAAATIAESGKKKPAKISTSEIKPKIEEDEDKKKKKDEVCKSIYVPLIKTNLEEQTVTGVVLQPEVVDAQGDIMSTEVISKAAHKFLAKYNQATKLGLQHKNFGKYKFELYESWIAPQDVILNSTLVKSGSWIMTVKVLETKLWDMVKKGDLKGFSIGGKAKVQKLTEA